MVKKVKTYFWSTDVLPCALNPTRLYSTLRVDAAIPSLLNEVLYVEYRRQIAIEVVSAFKIGADNK